MRVPFVGASNPHRSVRVSTQRLLNGYLEIDPEGKFQVSCHVRPGLVNHANIGSSVVRGVTEWKGDVYAVVAADVKKLTSTGTLTTIGTIGTSSGPVIFAANTVNLAFVDGDAGYYTDGSTVTKIADSDFPNGATHIVYHSGFLVVNDPSNPGRAYRSDFNDVTAWGSLNFATAERDPDALKALIVANQQLWLMGDYTTEAWASDGSDGFSFSPMAGGFTEVGIAAPYSVASLAGNVFWLAKNRNGQGVVFRGAGIQGQRISTASVEKEIEGYSTISDAIGFCLWMQGHGFYVLTFPTADATWVWDEASGMWSEWPRYGGGRFRANCHAFAFGKHLVGDYQDGNLFELSMDAYSDANAPIVFERWDRHIVDAELRRPLTHNALELELEMGAGSASLDPKAMLQWSDDGGHTWSNEHWRGMGNVGQYRTRAVWRRLGQSRDRVYRLIMTDSVKRSIVSGWLDASVGS